MPLFVSEKQPFVAKFLIQLSKVQNTAIISKRMDFINGRKKSFTEQSSQKIVIGVAGGSAAGKTTLCDNIFRQMAFDRNFKVEVISLDSFYKSLDRNEVDVSEYNFDHPNAIDFDLAYKTLLQLVQGNTRVEIPRYSFTEYARLPEPTYAGPANIIFFEGLMAFHDKRIRELLTYKIFINCDDDLRLCRRLKRDTSERGRSVIAVLEQYNKFVKKAYQNFILPTTVYADITIPGFRNNRVSVDFIVQNIKNMARRITFKERAIKTKTFIFGESEIYDMQYHHHASETQIMVALEQESFLVFPTSSQHRKELEFFLTTLLSEIFSVEYFQEIYLNQFVKVLKTLLKQLIALKNFNCSEMQVFSVFDLKEKLNNSPEHPIKLVFFPIAEMDSAKSALKEIKEYVNANPKSTVIILNPFCEMSVPSVIYKLRLSNVILINLFVIANQKRFKEILTNNIGVCDGFEWFVKNTELTNAAVECFSKEFSIKKIEKTLTT